MKYAQDIEIENNKVTDVTNPVEKEINTIERVINHTHDGLNSPKIKSGNLLGSTGSTFTIERSTLTESDFTRDNTYRELTLDSKYDDATMLLVNVNLQGTVGNDLKISGDGATPDLQIYSLSTTVYTCNMGLVPLDVTGKIYYRIDSGINIINFYIAGYYN